MKRAIVLAILLNLSYSFQLAVSKIDEQKLKNCGINCVEKGNVCVFFDGNDKAQAKRLRNYLFNEYGIQSFYINDSSALPSKNLKHIYSYQIISTKNLQTAKKIYKKFSTFPKIRIEKIGNYYVVRFGIFKKRPNYEKYNKFFLTRCFFKPQRVVK
ncbi:hypothetical protein [Caminibacter sp.]